jgi:phosphatidylcholine synthase
MESVNRWYIIRAWLVHLYTSLGLVAALFALYFIFLENPLSAFIALGVANFIDTTDGTLARRFQVTTFAPQLDGRKLDDIVDYLNYAFLPIFFAYRFGLVGQTLGDLVLLGVVLIAASYGFCQIRAKTDDGYFTGWPNYWNFVVFYFYLLNFPVWLNETILLVLAFLVFVPVKYPSFSAVIWKKLTLVMTGLYGLVLFAILMTFNHLDMRLVRVSLLFPAYYLILSATILVKTRYRIIKPS